MDEMQASAQTPTPGHAGPEQADLEADRQEWREWRNSVDFRFSIGDRQFTRLRKEMKGNTEITSEIRDIVQMGKSFFKFMQGVAKVLGWCWSQLFRLVKVGGTVAAAAAAIWAFVQALKTGAPPKP